MKKHTGRIKMDENTKEKIIEALSSLAHEHMILSLFNASKKDLEIAKFTIDLARKLDYFPKDKLEPLMRGYDYYAMKQLIKEEGNRKKTKS